jgi:hypothetical protein
MILLPDFIRRSGGKRPKTTLSRYEELGHIAEHCWNLVRFQYVCALTSLLSSGLAHAQLHTYSRVAVRPTYPIGHGGAGSSVPFGIGHQHYNMILVTNWRL